jgi:hypothetical protein
MQTNMPRAIYFLRYLLPPFSDKKLPLFPFIFLNISLEYSLQVFIPGQALPEHWLSPEVRLLPPRLCHEVRRSPEPASRLGPLLPAAQQDHIWVSGVKCYKTFFSFFVVD